MPLCNISLPIRDVTSCGGRTISRVCLTLDGWFDTLCEIAHYPNCKERTMSIHPRIALNVRLLVTPIPVILGLAVFAIGCGEEEETTGEWETPPESVAESTPEFKIDSLMSETRRLKDQNDALAAENRNLTARAADLETRLNDAMKAPPAPATVAPAPVADVSSAYESALSQFRSRNYQEAINQFQAILNSGGSRLTDNCHYWIGESEYALRRYNEAIREFETVLGYSGSEKRPYAQLMIGNSYTAMGDRESARDAYNKVVSGYPASVMVEKAKEKLARMR
jgi:tol-pal system protein YbgF